MKNVYIVKGIQTINGKKTASFEQHFKSVDEAMACQKTLLDSGWEDVTVDTTSEEAMAQIVQDNLTNMLDNLNQMIDDFNEDEEYLGEMSALKPKPTIH